jgi:hypothetical protein
MTAPGNGSIEGVLGVLLIASCCYAAGRLHQWLRQGTDRDTAFREGYDLATRSLWALAARTARRPAPRPSPRPAASGTATVTPIDAARGRHSIDQRIAEATTCELSPAV